MYVIKCEAKQQKIIIYNITKWVKHKGKISTYNGKVINKTQRGINKRENKTQREIN